MKTEILPFTEGLIPKAGNLLAERHKRNRAKFPLLPARFEDINVATKAIETLWGKNFKNGYAAMRNGKLVAYLLGEFVLQSWGRCGYVYLPGYSLADGESASILQDLYARLGDDWVKKGIFSHGLYISAADAHIVEAFFDLGFGKERVDALLDLRTLNFPKIENPAGIQIRRAGKGDNQYLGDLSGVISRALAKPPYWHPTIPEDYEELREGWSELPDEKDWTVWLALENNEVLGAVGFRPEHEDDTSLLASPRTVYLSIAATQPKARGRGISTALTWHGLGQARKDGFEICYTNWISPNLLAARHWPRYGFKDVAYRLAKRIDPIIAWARDEQE